VRRIIFMSISGVAACSSAVTQAAASTTAPASRPRTRGEPQPHSEFRFRYDLTEAE
jgi:hypothetical protein